jgi:hypothetical protein
VRSLQAATSGAAGNGGPPLGRASPSGGVEGAMRFFQARERPIPSTQRFMFATGIVCSYPTIHTPRGRYRVDELETCAHYARWREDFRLIRELGIGYLRYGPPYYRTHLGPERTTGPGRTRCSPSCAAWASSPSSTCATSAYRTGSGTSRIRTSPATSPPTPGRSPRYPWVRLYTPVDEMYVAAQFSAHFGWWNGRLTSHRAFVTALKHLVRADVEAMFLARAGSEAAPLGGPSISPRAGVHVPCPRRRTAPVRQRPVRGAVHVPVTSDNTRRHVGRVA